jgi:hypothetical protein
MDAADYFRFDLGSDESESEPILLGFALRPELAGHLRPCFAKILLRKGDP